jgi:hypothetical protein
VFPQKYVAVEKLEISEIKGNFGDRKMSSRAEKVVLFLVHA